MQITLWPMIFLQLCSMFKSRVYGFQTNVFALKRSASKIHSLATHDNDLVPTVKNPISKRKIHVGGPKFNDFIKQGMWVQHQGTLQKLDLRALSDYQQGILAETTRTIQATLEQTNQEFNTEDWHCITPTLAQQSTTLTSPLGENELSVLKRQLLFVNKPSGFHCVPSRDLSDSLSTQIASIYPAARPCHRLDRDTSGSCFARVFFSV